MKSVKAREQPWERASPKIRPGEDGWLPRKDSNLDKVIQNHLCYHYTTRQNVEGCQHGRVAVDSQRKMFRSSAEKCFQLGYSRATTSPMNRAELVETLRQRLGTNVSRAEAERALRGVLESVKLGLRRDRQVQLVGFGTFRVSERKPRAGVNPRTGEPMQVPGGPTIKFSAGKTLKNRV